MGKFDYVKFGSTLKPGIKVSNDFPPFHFNNISSSSIENKI